MNNLEFSNLIHGIIQTKFPKLENRLEIIIESRANNDQIYGSGIKNVPSILPDALVIKGSPATRFASLVVYVALAGVQ